jgi:hypothetical protein
MVDIIRNIIGMTITNYWGGFFWILLGFYSIYYTIKNPQKNPYSVLQGDMKGWAAGIGGVLLGIVIISLKLLGKL